MSDWINDRTPGDRITGPATAWRVVVPVKGGPEAKSRLRAPDGVDRLQLARALALDTVAAAVTAMGAANVVVVSSDDDVIAAVGQVGARALPDPGRGLDEAVRAGLDVVPADQPAAVLLGDVPALRVADLRAALRSAEALDRWFVPDAEGTGTVLLGARTAAAVQPRFGAGSAARHEAAGHRRLEVDLERLRRDVDDEASLGEALRLGVGPHTAHLLAHLIGL